MSILVTGSAGHLGEGLLRTLRADQVEATGLDIKPSPFTDLVGSIADRECVRKAMRGVRTVFHAATLHKPHVATHSKSDFVETNIQGTLVLLEEAVRAGVESFIFTSTTSVFGDALRPPVSEPAAWVTEEVTPIPKNIYGVTKTAAEDLCQLFYRKHGLHCLVLRTSRFSLEEDDNPKLRADFTDDNTKANEFLYRRVDLEDVVTAHLLQFNEPVRSASAATSSARRLRSRSSTWPVCGPTRRKFCGSCIPNTRTNTDSETVACSPASTAFTSTRGPAPTSTGIRNTISPESWSA